MMFFLMIILFLLLMGLYFYYIAHLFISKKLLRIVFSIFICLALIIGLILSSNIAMFIIYFYFIALLFDILYFFIKKIIKKDITKYHIYLYLIPLIFTSLFCIYGRININVLHKTQYNLTSSKLSSDIKILFISDTHYGKLFNKEKLDKLIKQVKKEKNLDFIMLGGDIIDENTSKKDMEYILSKLGSLKSTYGTYYVYGNHDKQTYTSDKSYSIKELKDTLKKNNITLLQDKALEINEEIVVVGREDYTYPRLGIDKIISEDMKDKYVIVLDHEPKDYNKVSKSGGNLILSGHTHNGQLFPIAYFIDLFKTSEMSYGYKKVSDLDAVVSSGIYGWGFPMRTQGKSEYVILNIKGQE